MAVQRTGYSGKPLYQKLGIKETHKVRFYNEPDAYYEWLEVSFPLIKTDEKENADMVHIFSREKAELQKLLKESANTIEQNGMIWVSWPKKASKQPTDITENTVRELAFPLGLVDVKVCSVSEVWSGLKVVIRKENRK
ncbi:DUF3052 family protein [Leptobacterium flavescens]|uniref:DUF3052 family protein n=1 Tax=Leptobacterium flavescens TaxID=472055 RepID=A0A6P0UY33_9FLAO|nr:DUF3052 family protein [Leptobacterium flavescens]NER15356.1 DUF3052 family protein [Leptobacterium flavescens]